MGLAERKAAYACPNTVSASPAGQIRLLQPASFDGEEGKAAVEELRHGRLALVNLENIPRMQIRRMVDFLGGAAYGLNGQICRVARCVYLLIPVGVEFLDERPDTTEPTDPL